MILCLIVVILGGSISTTFLTVAHAHKLNIFLDRKWSKMESNERGMKLKCRKFILCPWATASKADLCTTPLKYRTSSALWSQITNSHRYIGNLTKVLSKFDFVNNIVAVNLMSNMTNINIFLLDYRQATKRHKTIWKIKMLRNEEWTRNRHEHIQNIMLRHTWEMHWVNEINK